MAVGTQTVITGSRTTYNTNTNIHVRDVESEIALLKPIQTPIEDFFLTNKFAQEEAYGERTKFEWFEDKYLPDNTTITLTGGAATEAAVVIGAGIFLNFDYLLVPSTGDRLLVTAGSGTTSITVKSVGGANITATGGAVPVVRLTSSYAENASKGTSITVQEVGKSGYCQIMKRLIGMTGREDALRQYTGKDWAYQWFKAGEELKYWKERMYLLNGAAYDEGSGGSGRTYSAGFDGSFTTNRIGYSGTLDEVEFDTGLSQIFDGGGSNERMVELGSDVVMDVNSFLKQRYQLMNETSIDEYGVMSSFKKRPNVLTYLHPKGLLHVRWNPLLNAMGTNRKYAKYIVVWCPENVKMRYCPNDQKGSRKYRIEKGIETPGDDIYESQYVSDTGLQVKLEETGGIFYQQGT